MVFEKTGLCFRLKFIHLVTSPGKTVKAYWPNPSLITPHYNYPARNVTNGA